MLVTRTFRKLVFPILKASSAALVVALMLHRPTDAATILIDDFITVQSATATAGSPVGSSTIAAPEAIGGERDMHADLVGGNTSLSINSNPFGGEILIHDSGTAVTGFSMIVWDGLDGDPATIDPTGLGGIDLTSGGLNNAIRMTEFLADLTGTISLTVFDASDATGDTWSRAVLALPGGIFSPVDMDVLFTDFTVVGANGAASFTNVGAISMEIKNLTTGSLDVQMGSISAVPEPSSGLLWLLGGLGAVLPRCRRQRQ
jgi:hypothetical protein